MCSNFGQNCLFLVGVFRFVRGVGGESVHDAADVGIDVAQVFQHAHDLGQNYVRADAAGDWQVELDLGNLVGSEFGELRKADDAQERAFVIEAVTQCL